MAENKLAFCRNGPYTIRMTKRKPAVTRIDDNEAINALRRADGRATVVAAILQVNERSARKCLVRLEVAGKVRRTGAGRVTRWEVVK
jgi:hypothetical protein